MIFFRVHTAALKFQRGEDTLLLFGKLKASFSAPINELSGMTVNLKDVDQWMKQALTNAPVFSDIEDALSYFFNSLKGLSASFIEAQISNRSVSYIYDGDKYSRIYRLHTWFKKDQTWVQLPVVLKTSKTLRKHFRSQLRHKKWSNAEAFARILKAHKPELLVLEVQNPDWKGSEKFYF